MRIILFVAKLHDLSLLNKSLTEKDLYLINNETIHFHPHQWSPSHRGQAPCGEAQGQTLGAEPPVHHAFRHL